MHGSFMILGVIAVSMVASYVAYKISVRMIEPLSEDGHNWSTLSSNNSFLEDDLSDILRSIPINRIDEILRDYLMYDKQIANTYSFMNDQMKFVLREFAELPHTGLILGYLRDMGLRIEHWRSEITKYWKNLPRFERSEPDIALGGLTVMVRKMIGLLPKDDLHALLWCKAISSKNFRSVLMLLNSPLFIDMCQQIGNNQVLRRHYYWAMEADIEATFALELFYAFRSYLTQELV